MVKEITLIDNRKIKAKEFCANKIQEEFDSFIIMIKLMGYDVDNSIWDYHDGDFLEYDFRKGDIRFRLLFHTDEDDEVLYRMDYYYHNKKDEVTFKLIVQELFYNKGESFDKEISMFFKTIASMA